MKKKLHSIIAAFAAVIAAGVMLCGCKSPQLEPGGAYAPTNELGALVYHDVGLALADASYKFAYESVLGVCRFERENRMEIWAIAPGVKRALDRVRVQIRTVDTRWASARLAYQANPTPAGLTTLQTILAEIQRLVPVAQGQLSTALTQLAEPVQPATATPQP